MQGGSEQQLSFDFPISQGRFGSTGDGPTRSRKPDGPSDGHGSPLYFAILPERHATNSMARLANELITTHRLGGKPKLETLLHISLAGLPVTDDELGDRLALATRVASIVSVPQFQATCDHVKSFGGPKRPVLALTCGRGAGAIRMLYRQMADALRREGWVRSRSFEPHVTIAPRPTAFDIVESVEPITWTVREFVLVRNVPGRGQYEYYGRWPLAA